MKPPKQIQYCTHCGYPVDTEDEIDCAGCGNILCPDCPNYPDGDDLPFCDDCADERDNRNEEEKAAS